MDRSVLTGAMLLSRDYDMISVNYIVLWDRALLSATRFIDGE